MRAGQTHAAQSLDGSVISGFRMDAYRLDRLAVAAPAPGRSTRLIRSPWLRRGTLFGFWTVLGLFFASQAYLYQAGVGHPIRWSVALGYAMSRWYAWGVLAPLLFHLARRFPLESGRWRTALLLHGSAALLIAPLQVLVEGGLRIALFAVLGAGYGAAELRSQLQTYLIGRSFDNLLTCGWILAVYYLIDTYRKYRERELATSQLEARLARAELMSLRMQLHPHFLFNTLHSIAALMHKDIPSAERMLSRLGDLLRVSLENAGRESVSLKEELEFLQGYLEIEQTRFRDRLAVELDIDPLALDARVPNLILQPLVENAIRHGIAPRAAAGRVRIRARLRGGLLQLQVLDNGPGVGADIERLFSSGVGLSNTRARLQQLYGPRHRFELRNASGGGLQVTLAFPIETPISPALESATEA